MGEYDQIKKALNGGALSKALGSVSGAKKPKKTSGGFFSEKWQPPHQHTDSEGVEHNPSPEPIVLIQGNYPIEAVANIDGKDQEIAFEYPFWLHYEHYNASKGAKRRYVTCSSGLRVQLDDNGNPEFTTGDDPCIPCHYIREEGAGGQDGYLSHSRKISFTAVVLKWFHQVQDGKFTKYEVCEGRNCPLCDQGVNRQFGRRVFWSMGPIWAETIMSKNASLLRSCACNGELEYLGFICPQCKHIMRNFDEEPEVAGEVEMYRSGTVTCPHCEEEVIAESEVACDECDTPRLVDLWSIMFKPIRIGDKYTPSIDSWRALKPKELELVRTIEPVEFQKFLKPTPLKDQAAGFGLKNPFEEDTSGKSEW